MNLETIEPVVIHYTPHYLYAPSVPYELQKVYPRPVLSKLKFILLLRDPVERAMSSYFFKSSHHFTRNKRDQGSVTEFQELMKTEIQTRKRYEACMTRHDTNQPRHKDNNSTQWQHHDNRYNYEYEALQTCFGSRLFRHPSLGHRHLDKGIYIDQLERWFRNFPPQYTTSINTSHHTNTNDSDTESRYKNSIKKECTNYFIMTLEEFKSNPKHWYRRLLQFLRIGTPIGKLSDDNVLSSMTNIDFSHVRLRKPNLRYRSTSNKRRSNNNSNTADNESKRRKNKVYNHHHSNRTSTSTDTDNYSDYLDSDFKHMLREFYSVYNKRLELLLHRNFPW